MKLIVTEKPEVARAVAAALGDGKRQQGYIECGEYTITHCIGHMVELYEPEDYDEKYKSWKSEDLPMVFIPWRTKVSAKAQQQYAVVAGLLRKADLIIHACDPDEEGQLILDWILQREHVRAPVKRLLINDNSPKAILREMGAMEDNSKFVGLGKSAEARSVADQLYGYNLTRAYTLKGRARGYQQVLNVGRVKTPILGLVVRRDLDFENHKKAFYYVVEGLFEFGGQKRLPHVTKQRQMTHRTKKNAYPAKHSPRRSPKPLRGKTLASIIWGKSTLKRLRRCRTICCSYRPMPQKSTAWRPSRSKTSRSACAKSSSSPTIAPIANI